MEGATVRGGITLGQSNHMAETAALVSRYVSGEAVKGSGTLNSLYGAISI